MLDKINIILQGFKKDGLGYLKAKIQTRLKWEREQRELKIFEDDDLISFQSQNTGAAFIRALGKYEAPKVNASVTVLHPKLNIYYYLAGGRMVNDNQHYVFPDNGWRSLVERLDGIEIPGNQDSIALVQIVRVLVSGIHGVLQQNKVSSKFAA